MLTLRLGDLHKPNGSVLIKIAKWHRFVTAKYYKILNWSVMAASVMS